MLYLGTNMSTLRSTYPEPFENMEQHQYELFTNKAALMKSSIYHATYPTTTEACVVAYQNNKFTNTGLGSLPIPSNISTTIFTLMNKIVDTFPTYVLPLQLTTTATNAGKEYLYFIFDWNAISANHQLVYCGITKHFKRRVDEHQKDYEQFYKHCLSASYFLVGFSLNMQEEKMIDLETLCIWTLMHSQDCTPLNVLFHAEDTRNNGLATLYKRFTMTGIFIANNRAFSISANLVQDLYNKEKHEFLQYLLTKTNEYNTITISGIDKNQPIPTDNLVFCEKDTFPFVQVYLNTDNGLVQFDKQIHLQLLIIYLV